MKTTLILSTIVMLFVWAGCSENMNLTDPSGSQNIAQHQPNSGNIPDRPELLWSLDEFKIWTVSEGFVENKVIYNSPFPLPALSGEHKYLITFDASSNADRYTNGYEAVAEVSKNGNLLCSVSDFAKGDAPVPNKVEFENSENFEICFHIVLMQVDGGDNVIPQNSTYLTLSDIKIYKVR
jgi:hypothetical protein